MWWIGFNAGKGNDFISSFFLCFFGIRSFLVYEKLAWIKKEKKLLYFVWRQIPQIGKFWFPGIFYLPFFSRLLKMPCWRTKIKLHRLLTAESKRQIGSTLLFPSKEERQLSLYKDRNLHNNYIIFFIFFHEVKIFNWVFSWRLIAVN